MSKILVVEDESQMAEGLVDNFTMEGYEARIAADGVQGYAMALEWKPDLILLDLMLPKKSGMEVCRELRAGGIRIPIIMLTAKARCVPT